MTAKMTDSLTISIPAYNEEGAIEKVIQDSEKVLEGQWPNYEILVINDGSSDQTGPIAEKCSKRNNRIKVKHHEKNKGFGPTLGEVFKTPTTDWILFIPGDGQISPEELTKLWAQTENHDFILGWRVKRNDPWNRRFTSWAYNWMVSVFMFRRFRDIDSAALVRREFLDKVSLKSSSVFIHAETCLKVIAAGGRCIEAPIDHRPRLSGRPSGNNVTVILKTFYEFLSYALFGRWF